MLMSLPSTVIYRGLILLYGKEILPSPRRGSVGAKERESCGAIQVTGRSLDTCQAKEPLELLISVIQVKVSGVGPNLASRSQPELKMAYLVIICGFN